MGIKIGVIRRLIMCAGLMLRNRSARVNIMCQPPRLRPYSVYFTTCIGINETLRIIRVAECAPGRIEKKLGNLLLFGTRNDFF